MVFGSRTLNDRQGFLGFSMGDFIGATVVMVASSWILGIFGWDSLGLPIALLFLVVLAPVRSRYRRKIVRDALSYYLLPRVVFDPKRSLRPNVSAGVQKRVFE